MLTVLVYTQKTNLSKRKCTNQAILVIVAMTPYFRTGILSAKEENMKRFRFHWLDGKVDEKEGYDAAHALTMLGYGAGALAALDYWEEIKPAE